MSTIVAVILALTHQASARCSSPTPQTLRPVYRLLDVGSARAPKLSSRQLTWVKTVEANGYWKRRIHHLWFSPDASRTRPLLIFYVWDFDLRSSKNGDEEPDGGPTYPIVGGGGVFERLSDVDEVSGIPQIEGTNYVDPFSAIRSSEPERPLPADRAGNHI
jgi:hypothetical protein